MTRRATQHPSVAGVRRLALLGLVGLVLCGSSTTVRSQGKAEPAVVVVGELSATRWTPLGPAPMVNRGHVKAWAGRVNDIAADPRDANVIYIATMGGGVWKTVNGGASWSALTDSQRTLSMGAIAISDDSSVIYAGTGDSHGGQDASYGWGILVSKDKGATWTLENPGGAFDRLATARIAVHPQDPNVAYAAMANASRHSPRDSKGLGVWKRENRAGGTWKRLNVGQQTSADKDACARAVWWDVQVDPKNPLTVYAAGGQAQGCERGIYKSTDGGATWSILKDALNGEASNVGRIAIALARSNPEWLYVSTTGKAMFRRSNNGGATWEPVNLPAMRHHSLTRLAVHPKYEKTVYVTTNGPTDPFMSTDGGVSWIEVSPANARYGGDDPDVDHHANGFDAQGRYLHGSDHGIFRLDATCAPCTVPNCRPCANAKWTSLNSNLQTNLFQGLGLDPSDPYKAVGGCQDSGVLVFDGDLRWVREVIGDGGTVRFSPVRNSNRVYATFANAAFFQRSDDGGKTWVDKITWVDKVSNKDKDGNEIKPDPRVHPRVLAIKEMKADPRAFYPTFAVDAQDGNRIVVGTTRPWESTDGGDSWHLYGPQGARVSSWPKGTGNVNAIALANNKDYAYVATGWGPSIYTTSDHGATWTHSELPAWGRVPSIQVDPTDPRTAYAVVEAFTGRAGHIFKTVDAGKTWSNISGNFADQPVWSLQIDPRLQRGTRTHTLYIGADDGVHISKDGGRRWERFGQGLPHAQVYDLVLDARNGVLAAATHGRGVWEILDAGTHEGGLRVHSFAAGRAFTLSGPACPVSGKYTAPHTFEHRFAGEECIVEFEPVQPSSVAGKRYAFIGWGDGVTANQRTIKVGNEGLLLRANFKPQYQLTVLSDPPQGGSMAVASGTFYDNNAMVKLSAAPSPGHNFKFWTVNGKVVNESTTELRMVDAMTVKASFAASMVVTAKEKQPDGSYKITLSIQNDGDEFWNQVWLERLAVENGASMEQADKRLKCCVRPKNWGGDPLVISVVVKANAGANRLTIEPTVRYTGAETKKEGRAFAKLSVDIP